MSISLFLFHRDLRIVDHNGLEEAAKGDAQILPLFIFTPEQVSNENKLKSNNSVQFMIKSLESLSEAIQTQGGRLHFGYGDNLGVLEKVYKTHPFTRLVETADYTPYAKERSESLSSWCKRKSIEYVSVTDSYLLEPGSVLNKSGKTFQKFTPFYTAARVKHIPPPLPGKKYFWFSRIIKKLKGTRKHRPSPWEVKLETVKQKILAEENPDIAVKGGREEGLQLLEKIPRNYAKIHDVPSEGTSMLSAHNHFGTVSIREVYHAGRGLPEFQRQLWWRDFYGHIMADFENLYGVGAYEFQKIKEPLTGVKKEWFDKWCKGETGVPLVDAGMKQLLKTGYMHNRVRLVTASWLVKDVKVPWRYGERFFAQHLVDYDATQNMMNWIWVASVLPFASAPFRKVSAEGTAEKFDPEGVYVKRWLN